MKLFGTHKNNEEEIATGIADNAASEFSAAAEPKDLVLDIEGVEKKTESKLELALKAETKELPVVEEELLGTLRTDLEESEPQEPEAEKASAEEADEAPQKEEAEKADGFVEDKAAETAEEHAESQEAPLNAVSYASMAEAVETAKKESSGRFSRDAIDDETLLAELYTLIGDSASKTGGAKANPAPNGNARKSNPVKRPEVRITPQDLQAAPEEFEDLMEDDSVGVPGWLKGVFVLLISLLLSAMTFYAVASDVLGKVF